MADHFVPFTEDSCRASNAQLLDPNPFIVSSRSHLPSNTSNRSLTLHRRRHHSHCSFRRERRMRYPLRCTSLHSNGTTQNPDWMERTNQYQQNGDDFDHPSTRVFRDPVSHKQRNQTIAQFSNQSSESEYTSEKLLAFPILQSCYPEETPEERELPSNSTERKRWRKRLKPLSMFDQSSLVRQQSPCNSLTATRFQSLSDDPIDYSDHSTRNLQCISYTDSINLLYSNNQPKLSESVQLENKIHLRRCGNIQNRFTQNVPNFYEVSSNEVIGEEAIYQSPIHQNSGRMKHLTVPQKTLRESSDVTINLKIGEGDRWLSTEARHESTSKSTPLSQSYSSPNESKYDSPDELSELVSKESVGIPLLSGMDIVFHEGDKLDESPRVRGLRRRTSSDATDLSSPSERRVEMLPKRLRHSEENYTLNSNDGSRVGMSFRCQSKSEGWGRMIEGTPRNKHIDETTHSLRHNIPSDDSDDSRLQRSFSIRLSSLIHRGFSSSVWLCNSHGSQSDILNCSYDENGSPPVNQSRSVIRSQSTIGASQSQFDLNINHRSSSVSLSQTETRMMGTRSNMETCCHDCPKETCCHVCPKETCCHVCPKDSPEIDVDGTCDNIAVSYDTELDPYDRSSRRRHSSSVRRDTRSSTGTETSPLLHGRHNDASDICLVQKSTMEEITNQQRNHSNNRLASEICMEEKSNIMESYKEFILSPSSSTNDTAIVMKVVHKTKCSNEELQRLTREVEFLSQLKHPHILSLLSFVDSATEQWMFFEHAPLGDLHHSTVFKTLTEDDACWLIFQIVLAIHALHTKYHIIHSDVKPHNILQFEAPELFAKYAPQTRRRSAATTRQSSLSKGELNDARNPLQPCTTSLLNIETREWSAIQLKLCDFGLAQQPIPYNRPLEFDGLRGTHGYFAPELLLKQSYDYKVDIWAIGIIAFTLIGGYEPFFPVFACTKEDVEFDPRYWSEISMDCKDFIRGLLQRSLPKRLSSKEALNHDWIRSRFVVPPSLF